MAKPKLALIPSTVGASVYSVLPSNGDGDFNFTRSSAATRINAQGLIETVAVGDNRLNYPLLDGRVQTCPHLLLEPQRTNLITYSEDFSNAYWTKTGSTITSNAAISPDGTLNADKLVENTSTGQHNKTAVLGSSPNAYSFSVYAKSLSGNRYLQLRMANNISGSIVAKFDLDNGTLVYGTTLFGSGYSVNSSEIIALSDGWYKCSISGNKTDAVGNNNIQTQLSSTTSISEVDSYTGDGTSGVYIWGAQVEEGSYPTSYVVSNSGSATTRLAEVCDGSGNASTFNDSEGVLMVDIDFSYTELNRYITISDGTNSNRVIIGTESSLNLIRGYVIVGGNIQCQISYTLSDITISHKILIKYKLNDFALWIDGFEVGTDTSGTTPIGMSELAFDNGVGLGDFYGKTKQLQYFDSALTDSELETLTSWMSFSDMAIDLNYTIPVSYTHLTLPTILLV